MPMRPARPAPGRWASAQDRAPIPVRPYAPEHVLPRGPVPHGIYAGGDGWGPVWAWTALERTIAHLRDRQMWAESEAHGCRARIIAARQHARHGRDPGRANPEAIVIVDLLDDGGTARACQPGDRGSALLPADNSENLGPVYEGELLTPTAATVILASWLCGDGVPADWTTRRV